MQMDNQMKKIDVLSNDLLTEILVRLHAKYILRCMSVQKSWYDLVKTPMFIKVHSNHIKYTTNNHHSRYLLFQNTRNNELSIRFDDLQCKEYCKISYINRLTYYAWFALSHDLICASAIPCRGLVSDHNIYLWNPLVKKSKTLPESPVPKVGQTMRAEWEALGFGFLPEVNDYVVVHIVKPFSGSDESDLCNSNSVVVGVYSLNNNSWKKVIQDDIFIQKIVNRDVAFVNGVAFWVGFKTNNVKITMCFDTKTDKVREISLSDWKIRVPYHVTPIIHPFGEFIAYFVYNRDLIDMWVLEGDPMNEFTWKKMIISLSEDVKSVVLGLRNNGEPILSRSTNMISYNLDDHEPDYFVDSWDRWTPYLQFWGSDEKEPYVIRPFMESLVLLDI